MKGEERKYQRGAIIGCCGVVSRSLAAESVREPVSQRGFPTTAADKQLQPVPLGATELKVCPFLSFCPFMLPGCAASDQVLRTHLALVVHDERHTTCTSVQVVRDLYSEDVHFLYPGV